MLFTRESALTLIGVIAPGVAFVVSYFDAWGVPTQTAVNAAAVALAGLATSLILRDGRLVPAILGFGQALVTVAVTVGWDATPEQQAGILTVLGLLVAGYVRQNGTAPVDELGRRRADRTALVDAAESKTFGSAAA